ncbi:MAG: flagellar biosynthetic protein FliR, partial [Pseudomonadota bacterium]
PVQVRVMLALSLTFLLLPLVGEEIFAAEASLIPLLLGEAFVGFYIGFSLRVMIFVLSLVGAIVAQSLSLSQIFGAGISEDSNTTISTVLTMGAATIFLSLGLHISAFELLMNSYDIFPPGAVFSDNSLGFAAQKAVEACADGFALAFSLACPFLLMNLAYYTLLGVLNRAMPQLMVTFVGMPAITLTGLALLSAGIAIILVLWRDAVLAVFGTILP